MHFNQELPSFYQQTAPQGRGSRPITTHVPPRRKAVRSLIYYIGRARAVLITTLYNHI